MNDSLHLAAFAWLVAGTLASLATFDLVVTLVVAAGFVVLRLGAYVADRRAERAR